MEKFGSFICKNRKIILTIAILLLIPALIGIKMTRINYDILVYLPNDIETIQGEEILSSDFSMGAFSIIILDNMPTKEILELENDIKKMDNVEMVVSIADALGTSIPAEMLPDEVKDKVYKENSTIMMATFKEGISEDKTIETV